jgi:hypothetical protein
MVELRDEDDGRVALIMDSDDLPFALEALMRAGYVLAPPSVAGAAQTEEEPDELPEEELENESLDELADELEEDLEEEPAAEEPRPARGRSRKTRSG